MSKINLVLGIFLIVGLFSCVPHKKLVEMENKYNEASLKQMECEEERTALRAEAALKEEESQANQKKLNRLKSDSLECHMALEKTKKLYNDLNELQQQIIDNNRVESSNLLSQLDRRDKQLQSKEKELISREAQLLKTRNENEALAQSLTATERDLEQRERKVGELQQILDSKDSAVNALKASIAKSLLGFSDEGLTVNVKNGKVYVSMEEQLLFPSASIDINDKGKNALMQLATALNQQKDVTIMVEGHTDNVPMRSATIKDNWDLSVLRATSIVRILTTEGKVDPTRVLATGRSEHLPVDSADTPEARAKNRRIEIILTPNLDELFNILNN